LDIDITKMVFDLYGGRSLACTGLAATRRPATPPPTTRPSGLARETDIPPDLLLVPWLSVGMNEPDKESISKRPCKRKCFQKNCNSCNIFEIKTVPHLQKMELPTTDRFSRDYSSRL